MARCAIEAQGWNAPLSVTGTVTASLPAPVRAQHSGPWTIGLDQAANSVNPLDSAALIAFQIGRHLMSHRSSKRRYPR
jgi:hypothetical protein